jgi:hypothetical protein
MHEFWTFVLSLVVVAAWWISYMAFGLLFGKFVPDGWLQAKGFRTLLILILPFLLAAGCAVFTAHCLEHAFHISILDRHE